MCFGVRFETKEIIRVNITTLELFRFVNCTIFDEISRRFPREEERESKQMTSMALGAELSPFDLIHLVSRRKYYVRGKPRHFFEFFFHKRAITNALELNLKEAALLSAQVSKETTLITVSKRLKQLKLIIITENSLGNFVNKSSVR